MTILDVEIQIFPVLVLASDIATMYPYFYKPVGKTRNKKRMLNYDYIRIY